MPPAVSKSHVKVVLKINSSMKILSLKNYIKTKSELLSLFYQFQSELLEALDEDDLPGFTTQVKIAQEINANFEEVYGVESGNKTILHLALEEDDGLPYCEELIKV